jgi:hypothetical protein
VPSGRLLAIGAGRDEVIADVGPVYCNGLAFGTDGRLVWVESYPASSAGGATATGK